MYKLYTICGQSFDVGDRFPGTNRDKDRLRRSRSVLLTHEQFRNTRFFKIINVISDREFRMLNELQDQLNKAKMDHELLKIKVQSLYTLMAAEGPQDLKANEMLDYIAQVC